MGRTVVIVDDHVGFRDQVSRLLVEAGYDVIGSSPDGRSALSLISQLQPDVVLLDVQLPDIDGFALMGQLEIDGPTVVLVSTREAADYGARVSNSRAAGFITKAELSARSMAAVLGPE